MQLSLCFRLLNSEIGNDPNLVNEFDSYYESFRLLNSEIGNDHAYYKTLSLLHFSGFRLLNSEIGNDLERSFDE